MNGMKWGAVALATGFGVWQLARRRFRYDFRNKVVLVTGSSRGLGLVLARALAGCGARLALCARDEDELQRAKVDVSRLGAEVLALPVDVTSGNAVQDLVREVENRLGPIDVLINNAGIIQVGPLATMKRQDFEQALAVNFWGAFNTIEAVLPGMRQRRAGRIVNISSIGGLISVPHLLPYSASKFALTGYSLGLRAELADDGIVVTTVCPGLMRTGSPRNAQFKGQHEAEYAWFSIGDALPLLSISAESAARRILGACRRGAAQVVLGLPARLAATLYTLFPAVSADLLGLVNRLLPSAADGDDSPRPGKESESWAAPSLATTLSDRAAARNNEIAPARNEPRLSETAR